MCSLELLLLLFVDGVDSNQKYNLLYKPSSSYSYNNDLRGTCNPEYVQYMEKVNPIPPKEHFNVTENIISSAVYEFSLKTYTPICIFIFKKLSVLLVRLALFRCCCIRVWKEKRNCSGITFPFVRYWIIISCYHVGSSSSNFQIKCFIQDCVLQCLVLKIDIYNLIDFPDLLKISIKFLLILR